MSGKPGVLMVEDDAALQRFATLALEDLNIELHCCEGVEAALQMLQARPISLVLTDLMLPGRSGFDLVAALHERRRASPRVVVFSAGLTPEVRARLAGMDVWRCLAKPCSVSDLRRCVKEGLCAEAVKPEHASRVAPSAPVDPVLANFGGNRQLHDAFRASCLLQFAADIQAGARACRSDDPSALRMLAHNLKSVLRTLGHEEASLVAAALERRAETGDRAGAERLWADLRRHLEILAA